MNQTAQDDFRTRYGPWALVAGASDGLGAEFAAQLAAKRLHLVLVARRAEKLAQLAARLTGDYGIQVRTLSLDLAQAESVGALLAQTQELEIGLLVYNAAASVIGPFEENALEAHLRELDLNCRSPLVLVHALGRSMMARRRGGVVLMSSLSATLGSALISNYAATKAYSLILAEGLWEEWRRQGVDVLACCPAAIRTPNYLSSLSKQSGRPPVPPMSPQAVAAEALAALGKQATLVPGRRNRVSAFLMGRVLPRKLALSLTGRVLRGLYASKQKRN
jgi:uncharacterized protein